MARRGAAVALMLFLAAAPAAADICAGSCAQHTSHVAHKADASADVATHGTHHHATTDAATPAVMTVVQGVPHTCASQQVFVTRSHEALRVSLEKRVPLAIEVFSFVPAARNTSRAIPLDGRHGPPGIADTITALRI